MNNKEQLTNATMQALQGQLEKDFKEKIENYKT